MSFSVKGKINNSTEPKKCQSLSPQNINSFIFCFYGKIKKEMKRFCHRCHKKIMYNSKINVILIHGKDTDPTKKWYPWLKQEIEKTGIEFLAPKLPKADDPILNEWLDEIEKLAPNENSILVGHSRGGVAILRWLEKQPKNKKVKKVILVATNNPAIKENNQKQDTHGFYELGEYNFEKIKSHCDNFTVLHSEDDEWVPFLAGVKNAKGLNAKFIKFKNKGHFGRKLLKQEIPELLDEITQETGRDCLL